MKEKKQIVIVGAGGFAREVLDIIEAIQTNDDSVECLGFIVDRQYGEPGTIINDLPILGDLEWLVENGRNVHAVCAIGAPELRFHMIKRLEKLNSSFYTPVHPQAIMTRRISIGEGSIITAGCILTNNIEIGKHVHVNLDCTIGHDVTIRDFVTISPGCHLSGNVSLGEGAFIGTGANILEKLDIGEWSRIGAGSTIIKDAERNTTVVGVPGKVIKNMEKDWHLG